MSEMVERVARIIAINNEYCGSSAPVPCVKEPPGSPDECQCIRAARTVIEAMREPTKAMIDAGEGCDDHTTRFAQGADFKDHWYAGIDAALD